MSTRISFPAFALGIALLLSGSGLARAAGAEFSDRADVPDGADAPLESGIVDLAQEVRETERAFAATMADRALEAFAGFLAEDVVFLSRDHSLRGREEVIAGWARYFEGEKPPFSWRPDRVEVLDAGDLALSTGPVLDPAGATIGTFTSIWRREGPGHWRIVFDRGCPVCPAP